MWQEKDTIKTYKKGEVVIKEGDIGREMFIIQSGSVDVVKEEGENKLILATLERGDFFGEMAILENEPRSASVIAREDTRLVVLNAGNFLIKIRKDPTFAFSVMQKMSSRIRLLNEKILNLTNLTDTNRSKIRSEVAEAEYLKGG